MKEQRESIVDRMIEDAKEPEQIKPNKSLSNIKVQLDLDSAVTSLKLRAIAKHAAALADELDAIDNTCEECGGPITIRECRLDGELISTHHECERCQTGVGIPAK